MRIHASEVSRLSKCSLAASSRLEGTGENAWSEVKKSGLELTHLTASGLRLGGTSCIAFLRPSTNSAALSRSSMTKLPPLYPPADTIVEKDGNDTRREIHLFFMFLNKLVEKGMEKADGFKRLNSVQGSVPLLREILSCSRSGHAAQDLCFGRFSGSRHSALHVPASEIQYADGSCIVAPARSGGCCLRRTIPSSRASYSRTATLERVTRAPTGRKLVF